MLEYAIKNAKQTGISFLYTSDLALTVLNTSAKNIPDTGYTSHRPSGNATHFPVGNNSPTIHCKAIGPMSKFTAQIETACNRMAMIHITNIFTLICFNNPINRKLMPANIRISKITILDPACGSGNFLTVSYMALRRLENRIITEQHKEFKSGQVTFKLMGYLCNWASTKDTTSDDADSQKQYEDWKAQFPKDINSFLIEQITELNNIYNPLVKKYASKTKKLKDMTDFMVLIRNMMEAGIQIEAEHKSWQAMGDGGIILNFKAAQITDTDNQEAVKAFTNFLCGINTISNCLAEPFKPTAFITAKGTIISYPLRYSPFSGFQRYINEIQKYMDSKPHTDWEEKNFNSAFKLNGENWELIRF